jgi:pyridoxine 4-dehydrogenase
MRWSCSLPPAREVTASAGLGATAAQVALAWLLEHYAGPLLIPGTADPADLAQNIAAGSLRLAPASVTALDQLARPGT